MGSAARHRDEVNRHSPSSGGRGSVRTLISGAVATILVAAVFLGFATSPASAKSNSKRAPGRGTVWVTNDGAGGDPVQVISGGMVIKNIEPFHNPAGIAFTPNGQFAYVTNAVSGGQVSVVNTSTYAIQTNIALPGSPVPVEIVMTPNGLQAYVADTESGSVDVIDIATNSVSATIPIGGGGNLDGLAVAPNGQSVYVTFYHRATADVAVINTSTKSVTDYIPVGGASQGIAVTPNGQAAHVANCLNGVVCVINTATNTVTSTIAAVSGGDGLAIPRTENVFGWLMRRTTSTCQ